MIDAVGIVNAAREATAIAIRGLGIGADRVKVLLDAGLVAPSEWQQEAFVRGDENIPAIAFASIVAKVTRDRLMDDLSLEHAVYGFEKHKGYGTLEHRMAIKQHGLGEVHRRSFCFT